jgi:hypothetical protein
MSIIISGQLSNLPDVDDDGDDAAVSEARFVSTAPKRN